MKMYVVFVKTGRENAVFHELKKRGFDAILPVKSVIEKGKVCEKIIFENYVFLRCELTDEDYGEIRKIRYIWRILGWEDKNSVPFLKKHEQRYIERLWNEGRK